MLLRKDQLYVIMPEIHDVLRIFMTDHNGLVYALQRIEPIAMEKLNEKAAFGRPALYCFDGTRITIYPRPDKDYEDVTVDYLPVKRTL